MKDLSTLFKAEFDWALTRAFAISLLVYLDVHGPSTELAAVIAAVHSLVGGS